jgi:hypothetical protein
VGRGSDLGWAPGVPVQGLERVWAGSGPRQSDSVRCSVLGARCSVLGARWFAASCRHPAAPWVPFRPEAGVSTEGLAPTSPCRRFRPPWLAPAPNGTASCLLACGSGPAGSAPARSSCPSRLRACGSGPHAWRAPGTTAFVHSCLRFRPRRRDSHRPAPAHVPVRSVRGRPRRSQRPAPAHVPVRSVRGCPVALAATSSRSRPRTPRPGPPQAPAVNSSPPAPLAQGSGPPQVPAERAG